MPSTRIAIDEHPSEARTHEIDGNPDLVRPEQLFLLLRRNPRPPQPEDLHQQQNQIQHVQQDQVPEESRSWQGHQRIPTGVCRTRRIGRKRVGLREAASDNNKPKRRDGQAQDVKRKAAPARGFTVVLQITGVQKSL